MEWTNSFVRFYAPANLPVKLPTGTWSKFMEIAQFSICCNDNANCERLVKWEMAHRKKAKTQWVEFNKIDIWIEGINNMTINKPKVNHKLKKQIEKKIFGQIPCLLLAAINVLKAENCGNKTDADTFNYMEFEHRNKWTSPRLTLKH